MIYYLCVIIGMLMQLQVHCTAFNISFVKILWYRYLHFFFCGCFVIFFLCIKYITMMPLCGWYCLITAASWWKVGKHIYYPFHLWMWLFIKGNFVYQFIHTFSYCSNSPYIKYALNSKTIFLELLFKMCLLLCVAFCTILGWTDLWENWGLEIWQKILYQWSATKESVLTSSRCSWNCGT